MVIRPYADWTRPRDLDGRYSSTRGSSNRRRFPAPFARLLISSTLGLSPGGFLLPRCTLRLGRSLRVARIHSLLARCTMWLASRNHCNAAVIEMPTIRTLLAVLHLLHIDDLFGRGIWLYVGAFGPRVGHYIANDALPALLRWRIGLRVVGQRCHRRLGAVVVCVVGELIWEGGDVGWSFGSWLGRFAAFDVFLGHGVEARR